MDYFFFRLALDVYDKLEKIENAKNASLEINIKIKKSDIPELKEILSHTKINIQSQLENPLSDSEYVQIRAAITEPKVDSDKLMKQVFELKNPNILQFHRRLNALRNTAKAPEIKTIPDYQNIYYNQPYQFSTEEPINRDLALCNNNIKVLESLGYKFYSVNEFLLLDLETQVKILKQAKKTTLDHFSFAFHYFSNGSIREKIVEYTFSILKQILGKEDNLEINELKTNLGKAKKQFLRKTLPHIPYSSEDKSDVLTFESILIEIDRKLKVILTEILESKPKINYDVNLSFIIKNDNKLISMIASYPDMLEDSQHLQYLNNNSNPEVKKDIPVGIGKVVTLRHVFELLETNPNTFIHTNFVVPENYNGNPEALTKGGGLGVGLLPGFKMLDQGELESNGIMHQHRRKKIKKIYRKGIENKSEIRKVKAGVIGGGVAVSMYYMPPTVTHT